MTDPKPTPDPAVVEGFNLRLVSMVRELSDQDFLTVVRSTGRNSLLRLADADQQQQQQQQQGSAHAVD